MDVNRAIIEEPREIGTAPCKPVVICEISAPLIVAGYQNEIVSGLYRLQNEAVIVLMVSNALKYVERCSMCSLRGSKRQLCMSHWISDSR
jgi:hypothetical protein